MAEGVVIDFTANLARFTSSIDRATNQLNRFQTNTQRIARNVRTAFAGLAIGASITGALRSAVGQAANFEQALSRVRAVTGATNREIQQLEELSRRLGATTSFSATEAVQGIEFLGRAGFETNEILQALPATLDLARAGTIELAESADIASNVLSQFGLNAQETGRVADVLAATGASANTTVSALADALVKAGPAARSLGIDLETTAAAVGVLGDNGLQAAQAGTALRGIFARLLKPTKDVQEGVEALGLSLEDIDVSTREFADILETLDDAGIEAAQAVKIFGTEFFTAGLTLTESTGRLRELNSELDNVEGFAREAAKTIGDNLLGDLTSLGSAAGELAIQLGRDTGLTGALRSATQALTGFLRGVSEASKGPDLEELGRRLEQATTGRRRGRSARSTQGFVIRQTRDAINAQFEGIDKIRDDLSRQQDEVRDLEAQARELDEQIAGIPEGDRQTRVGSGRSRRRTRFGRLVEEREQLLTQLSSARDRQEQLFNELTEIELAFEQDNEPAQAQAGETGATQPSPLGLPPPEVTRKTVSAVVDGAQLIIDVLKNEQAQATLTEEAYLRYRLAKEGASSGQVNEAVEILRATQALDEREKELDMLVAAEDRTREAEERRLLVLQRQATALEEQSQPVLELERKLRDLNEIYQKTTLSEQALIDETQRLVDEFMNIGDTESEISQLQTAMEALGDSLSSAFEDAIVDGEDFRDVLDAIGKDILRITTRELVTKPISEGIRGFFSRAGAQGGGAGGAGGGFYAFLSSFFGGARQFGGPTSAGRAFLVGERGPELFVPNVTGRVEPVDTTVSNNVTVINQFPAIRDYGQFQRSSREFNALQIESLGFV